MRSTWSGRTQERRGTLRWLGWAVFGSVLLAVALRVPFLRDPLGSDEAGLLLVVRHFDAGSATLYGDYWVDRPPLLLAYFWAADHLGGAAGVRLLGCVVSVVLVLTAAVAGHALRGRQGAAWGSLVAALLGSSYAIAGHVMNGMLQAATLTLASCALTVAATTRETTGARFHGLLFAAGLVGMSAALVKQSFVCGLAFGLAVVLTAAVSRQLTWPRAVRGLAALGAGAATAVAGVLLWAVLHGIDLADLWFAVVEFRVLAADVTASTGMSASAHRVDTLMTAFLASGLVLFVVLFSVAAPELVRSPRTRPHAVGVAVVLGIALVSVVAGGSWWRHYLVQLVPFAVLTAVLLTGTRQRWARSARVVVLVTAACSLVATAAGAYAEDSPEQQVRVGRYLAAAAEPEHTGLVTWGHPEVLLYARLTSPYPYLWSLPARTLDRDLEQLLRVVRGPRPPTWIVQWRSFESWDGRGHRRLARAVEQRYRMVATPCGEPLYLLRGVRRALPSTPCADA
jgi:hypothetical protein